MIAVENPTVRACTAWSVHAHSPWHLCYVRGGILAERLDAPSGLAEWIGRYGSLRLSRPGTRHRLAFPESRATFLIVEGAGPFWERVFARAVAAGAASVFAEAAAPPPPGALDGACALAIADWLGEVVAGLRDPHAQRRVRRAATWLPEFRAYCESPTASRLGGWLDRHRAHVARSVVAITGFRPVELRTLARVRWALAAMREPARPLADIALAAGFAHQSHLHRACVAVLGRTPGEWRGRAAAGHATFVQDASGAACFPADPNSEE